MIVNLEVSAIVVLLAAGSIATKRHKKHKRPKKTFVPFVLFVLLCGYTTRGKEEQPHGRHFEVYDHLSVLRSDNDD